MKAFLLMMILVGCGTDESQLIPQASPTPTPATPVETKTAATSPEQKTVETPVAQKTPTVIPTPTPTPTSPFQSQALIVQAPFETDNWKFDFRSAYDVYDNGMKYTTGRVAVTRKLASGNYVCPFHTTILIGQSYGTIYFTTDYTTPGCGVVGSLYTIYFKISNQCQGYNQSTYICGQNTTYDLVEL